MDDIFEVSTSLSLPAEVAEAEGLVTKPSHSTANKWGPILYNSEHHPLHIMVLNAHNTLYATVHGTELAKTESVCMEDPKQIYILAMLMFYVC